MHSRSRAALVSAAAATLMLASTGLSVADTLDLAGDEVVGPATVNLGDICVGASASEAITATVIRSGAGNVFANGSVVTISAAPSGGASLATTTVGPLVGWVTYKTNGQIDAAPDNGESVSSSPQVTVAVPTGTTTGARSANLTVLTSGAMAAGSNPPTAPVTVTWNVVTCPSTDTTGPVVTPIVSGTLGGGDWYTSDVTVSWTVTDGESAITSQTGCGTATLSVDSAGTTYTCIATSAGGTTTVPITVKRDTAAPGINCGVADAAWHPTDVSIGCTASDGTIGSGLASAGDASFLLSTAVPANTEPSNASTGSRLVTDVAGNTATAGPIGGNRVDKRAPSVSCGTSDGLWHADNVSIPCAASDGGAGLLNTADASFNLSTTVPANTETPSASTGTRTVADAVGNSTSAGPVGDNKVDRLGPTVSITAPLGSYVYGQSVVASYSCSDGGSGLASCNGGVPDGGTVDTTSAGTHTFTVTGSDYVGNSRVGTSGYTVGYSSTCDLGIGGAVLQPVNANGSSTFKRGSTVPVKFRVCDVNGDSVGSSSALFDSSQGGVFDQSMGAAPRLVAKTSGTGGVDEAVNSTTPDTAFRWDPTAQQWIFNQSTKNLLASTTYTYRIYLNSGDSIDYTFAVK